MSVPMALFVLPMPPSVNAIWGWKKGSVYRSDKYKTWIEEANACYQQQKKMAGSKIKGHFTYHVILDDKSRTGRNDGDNLSSKALLDFMQMVGVIENESLADGGGWTWGPLDGEGMCQISLWQKGMQPA